MLRKVALYGLGLAIFCILFVLVRLHRNEILALGVWGPLIALAIVHLAITANGFFFGGRNMRAFWLASAVASWPTASVLIGLFVHRYLGYATVIAIPLMAIRFKWLGRIAPRADAANGE